MTDTGQRLAVLLTVLGVASGVGCGGSNPQPQTPAAEPSPPDVAATRSPPGSAAPADSQASPEVMAGIRAFDAGNYADARKAFESATKKNPGDAQAFYSLGLACEKLGDKAAAEAAYKTALSVRPNFDTAAVALSSLQLDAGRVDDALAVLRACLAKQPGSAPLHENLGVAMAMRGDQNDAIAEFDQAVKIAPSEPMYHLTLAHWLNTWHVRGAVPHLDAALGAAKEDVGVIAAIGFEYRMAGQFDSCIKTFDRAAQLKDGGEVRTQRALCKLGMKDDKGALADFQAAVAKDPNYAQGHYYLAGRLAHMKKYKDAAAEYAKYLELEPNGSLAKQAAEKLRMAQDAAGHDKGTPAGKK
jgi:tetratricopeptide (TPR) repeat protein